MIFDEVPQAKHLWLLAQASSLFSRFWQLTNLGSDSRSSAGICRADIISYQERISQILAQHSGQITFIPFLSREPSDFALLGCIPQAIIDGRLEIHAGIKISTENSQIMLCGNLQMVKDTANTLIELGLKKHHRFEHGQITAENYW